MLDAFQIQDITTEGSYLEDLGRPEAARAKQEADIAEAVARRAAEQARLKAEEEIAVAQRTFALKQAAIKAETDSATAQAQRGRPARRGGPSTGHPAEHEKVAQRQAALKDRQLDTEIRKPADAEETPDFHRGVSLAARARRRPAAGSGAGRSLRGPGR